MGKIIDRATDMYVHYSHRCTYGRCTQYMLAIRRICLYTYLMYRVTSTCEGPRGIYRVRRETFSDRARALYSTFVSVTPRVTRASSLRMTPARMLYPLRRAILQ